MRLGGSRRSGGGIALAAAAIAAVALVLVPAGGSTSAETGRWSIIYLTQDLSVPSGSADDPSIKSVTLRCPKGYRTAGGGLYRHWYSDSYTTNRVKGPDVYFMQVRNHGSRLDVTVWVNCVLVETETKPKRTVPLPEPQVVETEVPLNPASHSRVTTQCPPGTFPVSAGYESNLRAEAKSSTPRGRGWYQDIFWDQPPEPGLTGEAKTQAVCLKQKIDLSKPASGKPKGKHLSSAVAPTAKLRFRLARQTATLDKAGLNRVTATCRSGEQAIGGGYELLEGFADLLGTEVKKGSFSALYSVEQVPIKPARAAATAVCVTTRIA